MKKLKFIFSPNKKHWLHNSISEEQMNFIAFRPYCVSLRKMGKRLEIRAFLLGFLAFHL